MLRLQVCQCSLVVVYYSRVALEDIFRTRRRLVAIHASRLDKCEAVKDHIVVSGQRDKVRKTDPHRD
jgi:hypothetical protein